MLPALLIPISVLGAYLTWHIRADGWPAWLVLGPAVASATVWIAMARGSARLGLTAVLFDVLVAAAYLATFASLGEPFRWWHAIGAVLAIAGVALMAH